MIKYQLHRNGNIYDISTHSHKKYAYVHSPTYWLQGLEEQSQILVAMYYAST